MRAGGSSSYFTSDAKSHAVAKYNGEFFTTLQEALNHATAGGEVSLIAHTEEGELTFPADGITLNLGGHTLTIPEGKKGIVVRNQKTLKDGLSNITICNGAITGSKSSLWVDTLYARNLTLRDLTISDIEVINGHDGISICRSDAVMENCRIENVVGAIKNNAGAMIAVESGTLTMNSCTIENCESGGSIIDAGVDSYLKTSPTLTMNDCRVAFNTGSYSGGLECEGAGSGNPWWAMITLNNTVITGNRARNKTYSGGGLNMIRTRLRMTGGAIYGNSVPDDAAVNNSGADVYVYKGYTNMVIPKAADMKDDGADLKSYFWVDTISNKNYEDGIDMGRNVNLTSPMGLKVDHEAINVARNMRTNVEYPTLSAAVADAQGGDTLQLCAADNKGGHAVTENTNIEISKSLTIDLNGHHLNGLASSGKVFTVKSGSNLMLIGGKTNGKGILEANEVDGAIENFGELEISGAITFKDKIFHRGKRLFITGSHGRLRISLEKDKYIEADKDLTADSVQVYLLDAAERAALNDRYHDHEDVLIGVGGTAALESVTSTPEIDNPHVRRVHKTDGPKGAGLYIVDTIPMGFYLDGVNGDDNAAGTKDAPVKTFAKARELVEIEDMPIDGIYVLNTVTVDGSESWSMPKNTAMIRYENFRGALVHVTGSLKLTNIAIDGHSEGLVTANSPLIDVENGTLELGEGAVVRNNTNTTFVTVGSHGNAAGGVLARGTAKVILNGGTVSGNEAGLGGGIGLYGNSVLTMNSGAVSRNKALDKHHSSDSRAAGGGIFVAGSSTMNFNGGSVSDNWSDYYGGGISLGGYSTTTISTDKDAKGSLNMNGGEIDGNGAKQNGGGLLVQANTEAKISAGSITNNRASSGLFTGGGIYVNSNANQSYLDYGDLDMTNVLITENTAGQGGGGIGACPTSLTLVFVSSGAAIYNNDAPKAHDVLIDATTGSNVFGMRADHVAYISHYMLGGGEARWQRDGTDLYTEPDTINQINGHTHMTTHRSLELKAAPTNEDIQKALAIATVRISGNHGGIFGGGLGTNGNVRIGTKWNISAHKVWDDADNADAIRPESIKVRLKATVVYNGETVEIPKEVIPFDTDATLNESNKWQHVWEGLPEVVPEDDPNVAQYKNLEITYRIDEIDVPEGYTCAVAGDMFKGYTITNKHEQEKTSIPVKKVWNDEGHEYARPESITVSLRDGEKVVRELVLNKENDWAGSFDDLPANRDGKKIEYTLTEVAVEGYASTVTHDAEKDAYTVTNTYTYDTEHKLGGFKVSKTVAGDAADASKEFRFQVRLYDANGNEITDTKFPFTGDESGAVASGETFALRSGETVELSGVPEGSRYIVKEVADDAHGYEIEPVRGEIRGPEAEEGTIATGEYPLIAYTNEKNSTMGAFSIQKTVEGEGADKSREFEFKVTIGDDPATPVDESKAAEFAYVGSKSGIVANGGTVKLKHGEKVTVEGLPAGTPFKVEEVAAEGYDSKASGAEGTIEAGKTQEASFVNTLKAQGSPGKAGGAAASKLKSGLAKTGDPLRFLVVAVMLIACSAALIAVRGSRKTKRSRRS